MSGNESVVAKENPVKGESMDESVPTDDDPALERGVNLDEMFSDDDSDEEFKESKVKPEVPELEMESSPPPADT